MLVAGKLDVPAEERIAQPGQGIEPAYGQQRKAQRLPPVVMPGDVALLVGQHQRRVVLRHAEGEVDPRGKQPQHEGGAAFIAQVDVVVQQHRVRHAAAQKDIAHERVAEQRRKPCQPYDRSDVQPDLRGVCAGGGDGREALRQRGIQCRVHGGKAALQRRGDPGCDGDGRRGGDQAQRAFQPRRQQQAQRGQAPEQTAQIFRRFFQQRPQKQHREQQPGGRKAPVQKLQKKCVHVSPPPPRSFFAGRPPPRRRASDGG